MNTSAWQAMASTSFRDSIGSLGWSRRNADIPVNTAPQGGFLSSLQSLNPFGDRGYVQLPTTEGPGAPLPAPTRREEEEGWFACESTGFPLLSPPPPHATFPCLASRTRTLLPLQTGLRCRTCAGSAWLCLRPPHLGRPALSRLYQHLPPRT